MAGPIPPQAATSTFQATRSRIGPVIAIAGVLGALWSMKQSYQGNHDIWEQNAAHHHTEGEYRYLQEGWGHDSGHPFFDHLEHRLRGILTFGPHGLITHYEEGHAYSRGFWNDVVLANLFPIALAIAGIYIGFTPRVVNGRIRQMVNAIRPTGNSAGNAGQLARRGLTATGRAGVRGAQGIGWLFRGGRAPFTLLGLGFGLYFLHQFRRVWSHHAQEERFRGWIHGEDHSH